MLKNIRITLAIIFWIGVTLLFLDFTGSVHAWLGWMAKVQFLPAVLALNFGVVAVLVVLTLLFGRIYCSVICPLGITQDAVSWLRGRLKKKNRFRFHFSKELKWVRYGVLAVFVIAMVAGAGSLAAIIAPYSAYGRIVSSLLAPVYGWGNNLLAAISEHYGSYAFYTREVWMRSLPVLIIAVLSLVAIVLFAWFGGRSYCNTICPVGTVLGTISRYSIFGIRIHEDKCASCGLCEKQCKSSCIDSKTRTVDNSRCVDCFDCIGSCKHKAIDFGFRYAKKTEAQDAQPVDAGKRAFMLGTALVAGSAIAKAQEFGGDGGLAPVIDKAKPARTNRITPPGSVSVKHLANRCTGCQLCVSVCPNHVLRPTADLMHAMQPEMSFEKGYCRPECTRCSEVCPAGAILPITKEEKTAIHVGHAEIDIWACVTSNGESCGNCARHCPAGAIRMVQNEMDPEGPRTPVVNPERCIGCGACEYVCPVRPLSAIHVEGNAVHHDERKEVETSLND